MKMKVIGSCLLFATIFFSCKKEDLSNNGTGNPGSTYVPLLSKVLIDNQAAYEYLYNDSNLITQEKSKYDYTAHHYNNNGLLSTSKYYGNDDILSSDLQISTSAMNKAEWVTMQNGKEVGILSYEYNDNGQLIKTICSRASQASSEFSEFSYDSNNRISRQTMYWENDLTGYIEYSYDGKGNLIKEALYSLPSIGEAELITATSYVFDNQPNPFRSTNKLMIPGINTNQNNIIKETYTIHLPADQGSDNVQIAENSYEYNGLGYPVSKNGNVTYIYK